MNRRVRLKGVNGHAIDISEYPELQERMNIKTVWSLHDEAVVIANAPFNPFTGERVERAEDAVLQHRIGAFIEDYVHDWYLGTQGLRIFSRTVSKDEPIELIVELNT